jgi:hypothetical protein
MRAAAHLFCLCLGASLAGCVSTAAVRPDGMVERQYWGYLKYAVTDPRWPAQKLTRSDITAIGLRAENGIGIGYFRDQSITAPLDCRLLVVVQSNEQLERVLAFIKTTNSGVNLCTAVDQ